jgi:hypothetical protein
VDLLITFDGVLKHEFVPSAVEGPPSDPQTPLNIGDIAASVLAEIDVDYPGVHTVLSAGVDYDFALHGEGLAPAISGVLLADEVELVSVFDPTPNTIYEARIEMFRLFPGLFTVPIGTPFTLNEVLTTDAFINYAGFGHTLTADFLDTFSVELSTPAAGVTITRIEPATDGSAVPEPSSLVLLGTGFIGIVGLTRKRRRSQRSVSA